MDALNDIFFDYDFSQRKNKKKNSVIFYCDFMNTWVVIFPMKTTVRSQLHLDFLPQRNITLTSLWKSTWTWLQIWSKFWIPKMQYNKSLLSLFVLFKENFIIGQLTTMTVFDLTSLSFFLVFWGDISMTKYILSALFFIFLILGAFFFAFYCFRIANPQIPISTSSLMWSMQDLWFFCGVEVM